MPSCSVGTRYGHQSVVPTLLELEPPTPVKQSQLSSNADAFLEFCLTLPQGKYKKFA